MTIYITQNFFSSLDGKIDLVSIIEKGKIKDLVNINDKYYCLSGSVGTGRGGTERIDAYEAIPVKNYRKKKKPLRYSDHFREVNKGNRERSYDGLLLIFKSKDFVLCGPERQILPFKKNPLPQIIKMAPGEEAIIKHSELIKFFPLKTFPQWLDNIQQLNIVSKYSSINKAGQYINQWNFKKI